MIARLLLCGIIALDIVTVVIGVNYWWAVSLGFACGFLVCLLLFECLLNESLRNKDAKL